MRKRRLICVLTALTVVLSVLTGTGFAFQAASAETSVVGDVNGDGKVTAADYQILKQIFSGKDVSEAAAARADINNDGRITSADYTIVKWIFMGIPVQVTPKVLAPQPEPSDDGIAFSYEVSGTISDNMVLQRNQTISVFGTADRPGGIVYAELMGETRYGTVDQDGNWCIDMSARKASSEPVELKVYTRAQGTGNATCFRNILVGDVWIIAGQSNAQVNLSNTLVNNPAFLNEAGKQDTIRLFTQWFWECTEYWADDFPQDSAGKYVRREEAPTPQKDVYEGACWLENTRENALAFSAVGYYFAKQVADHTNVPIGMIQMVAGGSALCDFMPPDQYRPELHKKGASQFYPSDIYNSLMAPFQKTRITGMLWYQGEGNVGDYDCYAENLRDFVAMMRNLYGEEMAFYNVQLTSHNDTANQWPQLPELRFAQAQAAELIGNYNLVCSMDYGSNYHDNDFAHPSNKKHIGDRLAYLALANIYDYKNFSVSDYGSPEMFQAVVKDGAVYFYFSNVGNSLKGSGTSKVIKGFTDYDTGKALNAVLETVNCVKVSIGNKKNITIAYGNSAMADKAVCNLQNSKGIGALAFAYRVN